MAIIGSESKERLSGAHDYHDALPDFDQRQLLHDGCYECERRGQDPALAIAHLDAQRFVLAWQRAYDLYATRGQHDRVGPVARAEVPLLQTLWAIQVQFERRGIPLGKPLSGRSA